MELTAPGNSFCVGTLANGFKTKVVDPSGGPNDCPYFFQQTEETNVTSQISKSAYLHCSIRQLGDKTVSWVRQRDLHILAVGDTTYTTDQRFASRHENFSGTWTLQIRYTRKEDAGIYECQVSTEPKMSLAILLSLTVVASFMSVGPVLYAKSGSPVHLTCRFRDEAVFLFWYLDDKILDEEEKKQRGIEVFDEFGPASTSTLRIARAKESDSGNYSCRPSHAEPANISLQVWNEAKEHGKKNIGLVVKASLPMIAFLYFLFLI